MNNGASHVGEREGQVGDREGRIGEQSGTRANSVQTGKQTYENKTSQLKTNFTDQNRPFTSNWYGNHPNAWQYSHPHADAWAVAGLGGAAGWLGLGGVGAANVYTGGTSTSSDDGQTTDDAQSQNAATTDGDQLTLGVFAIAPATQNEATALVQLSANKQGQLSGTYFDVLTEQEQPISGTIDKQGKALFRAGQKGSVAFETTLADLTQSTGTLKLLFDNGQTREWTLARFDQERRPANN